MLLFNAFLKGLAPPIGSADLPIGMVSFATTVVLLALSLLIRKRITALRQQRLAILSIVMLGLAFAAFFLYRDMVGTYVFEYPPDGPLEERHKHVRGELHAMGLERVRGKSIAEAVRHYGGPEFVSGYEILWTEASQGTVERRLEAGYLGLSMLLTVALFVVAITVWRALPAERK
ncbi:hypothetical protein LJR175_008355 [Variovorax sp. LjRoot175]|uniref:hypothetical protein n=1 Tax=Variovorax sp. LjRoot175 TaxID=3342276 RepID=UPI003ECDA249